MALIRCYKLQNKVQISAFMGWKISNYTFVLAPGLYCFLLRWRP